MKKPIEQVADKTIALQGGYEARIQKAIAAYSELTHPPQSLDLDFVHFAQSFQCDPYFLWTRINEQERT